MYSALKTSAAITLSFAFLYAVSWAQPYLAALPGTQYELYLLLPYAFATLAMTLSLYFNQSRAFFLSLLIGLGYAVTQAHMESQQSETFMLVRNIFLPTLAIIALLGRDRGVLSTHGRIKLTVLSLMMVLGIWLTEQPAYTNEIQRLTLIPGIDWLPVPQALAGIWILLFLTFIFLCRTKQETLGYVALAAITSIISVSYLSPDEINTTAAFATANLLLLLSVAQSAYHMAFLDRLTNLPNRRALDASLLKLPRRYSIAMLDVDHFKQFNDKYGHDVGDEVLKMVASKMARVTGGGKPARYGGEEFCIVFPRKHANAVLDELESVRESIESSHFQLRKNPRTKTGRKQRSKEVSVTISIGVAQSDSQNTTPEQVIKKADQALYRAKKKGRNQVVLIK